MNDGITARNEDGSTTVYEVRPVATFPALGDLEAWEAHRRDIEFINQMLLESIKSR